MIRKSTKWACGIAAIVGLTITLHGNELQTSKQGLLLIGDAEGCQRKSYHCPSDALTFGIGTTETVEKIIPNKIYSNEEIASAFAKGVKQAENVSILTPTGKKCRKEHLMRSPLSPSMLGAANSKTARYLKWLAKVTANPCAVNLNVGFMQTENR